MLATLVDADSEQNTTNRNV